MTQFFAAYGLFLLKAITVVIAILATVGGAMALSMRNNRSGSASARGERLEITSMNETYTSMHDALQDALLSPAQLKVQNKLKAKEEKAKAKEEKKQAKRNKPKDTDSKTEADDYKKRLYVLDFDGDIKASAVDALRQEITAVLTMANEKDEILVRVESGGGEVHSYGLAASQLQRIRDKEIPLTIAVDKVAASGGYLMACVGDKILAAPFAILGSIGVIAQIPNLHKVLKKNDIDIEQLTAGEYKRTLTLLGENTDKARTKMQEELEEVHQLFKNFVLERRPQLDVKEVATGEHWLGSRALELKLVDELVTSDDYIMAQRDNSDIIEVAIKQRRSLMEKVTGRFASVLARFGVEPTSNQPYPKYL